MAGNALQIVGLGASTPIGRDVWASAAAARAGVCGFSEHPYMVDTAGEPMRIARAPWLDVGLDGSARLGALLLPAIEEALAPLTELAGNLSLRIGLALGLPPPRPGQPDALVDDLLVAIRERMGNRFVRIARFEVGHAAGHMAMAAAEAGCARDAFDACVVAGIDSYLAPETLEWVEACDQLHGGGPLNNAWGFIPGEAAGAVLLGTPRLAQLCGIAPLAELVSVGIGMESRLIKTDEVCVGEGLTQAFRAALKVLGARRAGAQRVLRSQRRALPRRRVRLCHAAHRGALSCSVGLCRAGRLLGRRGCGGLAAARRVGGHRKSQALRQGAAVDGVGQFRVGRTRGSAGALR